MMATFAELTGQKASNTDGISILPELTGNSKAQQQHKYLYFEYPEKGGQLAIRMGDWKGVKTNLRNKPDGGWMIFNLRTDRNETTDVAAAHPELVKQFDEIVRKEHQSAHIKEWEFINPKFDGKKMGQ
jgi:arylsulfatase A-like enzyme